VAVAQKERHQPAADGAGGASEEYFHGVMLAGSPGCGRDD
jgi:hypothetical protein